MTVPAFLEQRMDPRVSFGFEGGPTVPGRTKTYLPNGRLQQNFIATLPVHKYRFGLDTLAQEDFQAVLDLFYVVMFTPFIGFRVKDWRDYQGTKTNTTLTAVTGGWQLQRAHVYGSYTFLRDVQKPCATPAIKFYDVSGGLLSGTVDTTTGIATVSGTPASWEGEFDVPVTFVDDEWMTTLRGNSRQPFVQSGTVQLEEIRIPPAA